MDGHLKNYAPDSIIAREGDFINDLYFVQAGSILVCQIHGSEIKALARINTGEFVGELSFFDNRPRSTYLIAVGPTTLIEIPRQPTFNDLPYWFKQVAGEITKKMRFMDKVLNDARIKKSVSMTSKPLTQEEQAKYLKILTN